LGRINRKSILKKIILLSFLITLYILLQEFWAYFRRKIRNFRIFDVTETKDLANVLRAGKLPG
jgi:preprotein translocase subunit SecD